MALAATSSSANSSLSYSDISLVPLRVNVSENNGDINIVETLVLDRNCWPIPLEDPLEVSIERNADLLAHTLITDLEVHGMGRTVRHFTGRVDLWSPALQQKIKNQLVPQLWHVVQTSKFKIVKDNDCCWKKKRQRNDHAADVAAKQAERKQGETETTKENASEESDKKDESTNKKENESTRANIRLKPRKPRKASLVPVRLRLCVNGVRIHDDFIWDLSVPQCPIEFAKQFGQDLNLSDEAVVAVVTSIVEQLDGSVVDDTKDLDANAASLARKHATAAWVMDHKENLANTQQLLALHRPSTST